MIKITNKAVKNVPVYGQKEWIEYLEAIMKLKAGQSFLLHKKPPSHYRLVVSVAKTWLHKRISIKRESNGWRVGCVEEYK